MYGSCSSPSALASDLNDLAEQLNSGSVGTDEAAYHLENLLNNVLESGEPASPELSQVFDHYIMWLHHCIITAGIAVGLVCECVLPFCPAGICRSCECCV